ncbi:uncharacterized protein C11orf53 homolog [Salvelinus namaycush]|uniref:Uncharacterized protein C11orf53 homolog n=1 Tax=Salvelinus namaycush TaxID=8040 RepID=A0A8U0TWH6_SALNM|nr:uncharacterized protein C11orf53 homolog [Salvelinus namaycush]
METEYSKRVYQGVRVKHTVKDLLAEKRQSQTNGPRYSGGTSSQSSFVQMPGSHMIPSYYGMRRPFISDSDFSPKQFPGEVYSSSLGGKPLGCDPSAMSGYQSVIDSYYPETFGDYRSAAFTTGGSSIFPSSALSTLLPPFSGESPHFLLRDSWEQPVADPVTQGEGLCTDGLTSVPVSLPSPDPPGSPSQYRCSTRSSSMASAQPYALHPLEEVHYHTSYPAASTFTCPSYMTVSNDLASKMAPLANEDSDSTLATHSDTHSWVKEDGGSSWSPYEIRRSY